MRVQSLTLAAASTALLAPTVPPTTPLQPAVWRESAVSAVSAADLLAKVRDCAPVSRGRYRSDNGAPAKIPLCGTPDAVFWKADMDIDCDGRPGRRCNRRTDPYFAASTAYTQSDGRPLSAERLPFVVVPAPSGSWDYRDHGIGGGSVVAVVYRDRVHYAVVGDTGPRGIIGEASYATAEALGIRPHPHAGGAPSGVTYIVFKNTKVSPIEDHAAAVAAGERAAKRFIDGSGSADAEQAQVERPGPGQAGAARLTRRHGHTVAGHTAHPACVPGPASAAHTFR